MSDVVNAETHLAQKSGPSVRKHLVFLIGEERFAVQLSQVKEVIGLSKITAIPNVPSHFKGLINLRGRIISIIDLRERLKVKSSQESKRPCIVIAEIENSIVGTIVDDVAEVVGIDESRITRDLNLEDGKNHNHLIGVARLDDKPLTLILDLGKAVNIAEIAAYRKSA